MSPQALDDEVDTYLIKDDAEIQLKQRVWEEMNKDYLQQARTLTLTLTLILTPARFPFILSY